MTTGRPRVVTLEEIEVMAMWAQLRGDWTRANWIRSQAQEIQIEVERTGKLAS